MLSWQPQILKILNFSKIRAIIFLASMFKLNPRQKVHFAFRLLSFNFLGKSERYSHHNFLCISLDLAGLLFIICSPIFLPQFIKIYFFL